MIQLAFCFLMLNKIFQKKLNSFLCFYKFNNKENTRLFSESRILHLHKIMYSAVKKRLSDFFSLTISLQLHFTFSTINHLVIFTVKSLKKAMKTPLGSLFNLIIFEPSTI